MNKSGEYLGQLRRHRGMTQEQMARAAVRSLSTIAKVETGVKIMSVGTYHRLMDVLSACSDERKIMLGYIAEDLYSRWVHMR